METFAGLSVIVLIASALVAAIRVFGLWRRTHGQPELLLGMMLVLDTVLGYPLAIACHQISAADILWIHLVYPLSLNFGFACLLLFTLRVFRPGVFWAHCLVGGALTMMAISVVLYIAQAVGDDPRQPGEMVGLTLFNCAAIGLTYFWTTFEAFRYYGRLRLQLRLGLANPIVMNRMYLWGAMTLAAGLAVVLNGYTTLAGTYMSHASVFVSSLLGLVHAGCLVLAFRPPDWYKAWVQRRYAAEVA